MRLIDADAIAERIETARENARTFIYNSDFVTMAIAGVNSVSKMIDDAPTVDAVAVVRCKDCKHAQFTEPEYIFCKNNWTNPPLDGFCSYGERKDDE